MERLASPPGDVVARAARAVERPSSDTLLPCGRCPSSASLLLVRWAILGALLFSEPETTDTLAGILFGPARFANDFPRLFLPAIDRGVLRLLGGELLWLGVSAAVAFVTRGRSGYGVAPCLSRRRLLEPRRPARGCFQPCEETVDGRE